MTEVRKLYIDDADHPWITWDKDLYKYQEKLRGTTECNIQFFGIEQVASPFAANTFFVNREFRDVRSASPLHSSDVKVFLYFPRIGPDAEHEFQCLQDVKLAEQKDWHVVTSSVDAYKKLRSVGLRNKPWLWSRPSRIWADEILDEVQIEDRKPRIVSIFDAKHPLSHAADLVKAYLGAFTILDEDHDIAPELMIFSHSELPFEPFNEIHFQGYKPNKLMFNMVREASLAIYPSEIDSPPMTAIETAQLGVPTFQFRNGDVTQREVFTDSDLFKYSTTDELTEKIVNHFVKIQDTEYFLNVSRDCKSYVIEETAEFGLHMFLTEIANRCGEFV